MSLTALCVDRFAPLAIYLKDIEMKDLGALSENDLLEAVDVPAHRLLMKIFLKENNLRPFFNAREIDGHPLEHSHVQSSRSSWPAESAVFNQ